MIQQHTDAARNMPRVVALHMRNGFMKNYNYLVIDPSSLRAVIVDPAWEIEKIDRAVADTQATLSGVLVTHSHPDHVQLAKPRAFLWATARPANVTVAEREYLSAVFR